ncbi:Transposable element Tcb2 transposase [Channa argus]|uniref:Transposable element Tcb2 transposase n=1 Tax=Channa argus TaxID=215402 RepID=A0A6G1PAD4_CHAAH|nr:Transposable element Tcb2 transposase [Channa argus]
MKHLDMQTAPTNICERMGRSQELSEFQRGAVIGCHLCNKSIREISSLLNIPQSNLQSPCGLQISSTSVRRELHGMGFHGRAAASKPYITKCNAKRRMQWCKARRHWTLEQWRRVF